MWWEGRFRGVKKPQVPEKACVDSDQHSKQRQTKVKRESCVFLSGAHKCGQMQQNLPDAGGTCARVWEFCKGKVQYLRKGTVIPLISPLWQEVSQPSQGCSCYLKDGRLTRWSTFPNQCYVSTRPQTPFSWPEGRRFPLMGFYCYSVSPP